MLTLQLNECVATFYSREYSLYPHVDYSGSLDLGVDQLASCFLFLCLKEVFHVNYYVNCTYDCYDFTANLMVDVTLIFHHNVRDRLLYCCCHFFLPTPHVAYSYDEVWTLTKLNASYFSAKGVFGLTTKLDGTRRSIVSGMRWPVLMCLVRWMR